MKESTRIASLPPSLCCWCACACMVVLCRTGRSFLTVCCFAWRLASNLMQVVFVNLHLSNPALCRSRLPLFLERLIQQFLNDTREEVATLQEVFLVTFLHHCEGKPFVKPANHQ